MNEIKGRHLYIILFFFFNYIFLLDSPFAQTELIQKQIRKYTRVDGLPCDGTTCIDQDGNGNLWIGTEKGISMFDGSSFINYGLKDNLFDVRIKAILCVDTVWCGTFNGFLFRKDGPSWIRPFTLKNRWETGNYGRPGYGFFLYADKTESRSEEFWCGSSYIYIFKYSNKRPDYYNFTGTGMDQDSEGNRYIINDSRLYKIDARNPKGYIVYSTSQSITDIIIDAYDEIIISLDYSPFLISTDKGNSFSELSKDHPRFLYPDIEKEKLYFKDLFIDKDRNIWGAESKSVFYNQDSHFKKKVTGETYKYIFQDSEGHIWICSANGLLKVDIVPPRIKFIDDIPERVLSKEFSFSFKGDDGTYGSPVEKLSYSYKYRNDTYWKNAKKGFVYLTGLKDNKKYIVDLRVTDSAGNTGEVKHIQFWTGFGKTIPVVEILNKESFIKPLDINSVTFEFSASDDTSAPGDILYSWALKKEYQVEKDWTPFSRLNHVQVTDLENGSYIFMVKARDVSGYESEPDKCLFTVDIVSLKPGIVISNLVHQYFKNSNPPQIQESPVYKETFEISPGRICFDILPVDPESENRQLEYAILLEPVDSEWSTYVSKNTYNRNVFEDGEYTLKARARAEKKYVSEVDEIFFKVTGFKKYPQTEIKNKDSNSRRKLVVIECDASEEDCEFSYSLDGRNWSLFQGSAMISLPVFKVSEYTVMVVAKNKYGIDPSPAEFSFNYGWNVNNPITNISSHIPDSLPERTITITFEAKDDITSNDIGTGITDFEFSYRLVPRQQYWSSWNRQNSITFSDLKDGPYFFQVKAKNTAGNESLVPAEKLFMVNLDPIFMRWWFNISFTIIVMGIGGGMIYLLLNEIGRVKKDIYNQRYNPYIVGEAVHDSEMFFGRDTLIKDIFISLKRNSLCLLGERRIGKTSLLEHLEMNTRPPFFSFFCSLGSVKEKYFFKRIMQHLVNKVQSTWKDIVLELTVFTQKPDEYDDLDFEEDLDVILAFLRKNYHKYAIITMFLDEIDATQDFSPSIHESLRNIFQTYKGAVKMVSAGISIKRGEWQLPTSPWYNFFEPKKISGLLKQDAKLLITIPVKGYYSYDRKAIDYILAKTDRKPYYIQTICKKAISKIIDEKRRKVTLKDVQIIYGDLIYKELNNEFDIFWESLSKELQMVIIKILKGEHLELSKELKKECDSNEYNHAHKVITSEKEIPEFSTFFRDWIMKNYVLDVSIS